MQLRALEIEDLPFLYQWENDAAAWGDSGTHNPLSQKLLREYIENATGDIFADGQLRLIIEHEGQTAGAMDLFDFDPLSRKAAIGMYIAPECRGKGFGQEAVRLLEKYAFDFLHLHQLYAIIAVDNAPCRHIYISAGYNPSATLKDWVLRKEGYQDAIVYQKVQLGKYD